MIKYKNILLVNAWHDDIFPAPSVGYLQSAIKSFFKELVSVTACNIDCAIDILSNKNEFDLVAVSYHSFSVKFARLIRELSRGKTLICGGHHPSAIPEQMINIGYDCVIIGEGENAIIDFILGNFTKKIFDSSLANKHFESIDEYPVPDYFGIKYTYNENFGLPIISSRGCPFSCNFCASSLFWEKKIKLRSADSVISEIENNIIQYRTNKFMFEDDNFTINKSRTIEICEKITRLSIKHNIKLSWQCASRADVLIDDELCIALVNAGCFKVWLGCESFSQDSLNRCAKHTTTDKMIVGINNAERLGLKTMCQFIVGLPGDTIENIYETRDYIKQTNMSDYGCNVAWILPNTEIHKKAIEKGFNNDSYLDTGAGFYTYEHSIETLQEWVSIINNAKL